jgi:hypothetical protein
VQHPDRTSHTLTCHRNSREAANAKKERDVKSRGSVVECGSLHRFSRRSVFEASPDASAVASWQLDGAVETRRLFRVKLQVKPIDFLIRSHLCQELPMQRFSKADCILNIIRGFYGVTVR